MLDYTINIEYIKGGVLKKHEFDFNFSNGIKSSMKYTEIPPEMEIILQNAMAHLLQNLDEFKKRSECEDFIKFELNKK